jgi:hypothetical protein
MRQNGVSYVVVHLDRVPAPQRDRIRSTAELPAGVRLAAVVGNDWIYRVQPDAPAVEGRGKGVADSSRLATTR